MPKTAAAIAKELSPKTSKNRKATIDEQTDEIGGIEVETEVVEENTFATGTPFDLVEGRPNVDFYGPLTAYGFVTTSHGEYAIPAGQILRFQAKKEWDKKTGMEVIRNYPVYEKAPQELVDYIMPVEEAVAS
jgi:hypothetical protein